MTTDINATKLAIFTKYVEGLQLGIKRQYDRNVNRDLSQQNAKNLLKRNIDSVLQKIYEDSLSQLRELSFESQHLNTGTGFSDLTTSILSTYDGIIEELLQYALHKHRTSCALSNFPAEHNPSEAYLGEVLQDINQNRQEFALRINTLLV